MRSVYLDVSPEDRRFRRQRRSGRRSFSLYVAWRLELGGTTEERGAWLHMGFRKEERRMHEFALAEGVIATALEAAEKGGIRRIRRIVVTIGELQQIEKELFAQILDEMMPEAYEQLNGVEIELREETAEFQCRVCGERFDFSGAKGELDEEEAEAIHFIPELAHTYLSCPKCGSPDFEVVKGRGVWIEAVEGGGE